MLDTVFPLPKLSVATHVFTFTVTIHCQFGVIVILYTVLLTEVNNVTAPLVTVTSHVTKLLVASPKVHVTTNVEPLKYEATELVNTAENQGV